MQVLMVPGGHITDAKADKPSRGWFLCLLDTESLEEHGPFMVVVAGSELSAMVLQL